MTLVFGATGQVGFAVVRRLRERGQEVTALARPSTDPGPVAATGTRIVHGDLRDPASLRSVCEGVDTVVATANTIVPAAGRARAAHCRPASLDEIAVGGRLEHPEAPARSAGQGGMTP